MIKELNLSGSMMVIGAIVGSTLLAMNLDISKYGYAFFLVSSIFGIYEGKKLNSISLTLMSSYFTLTNITGVYRWIVFPLM